MLTSLIPVNYMFRKNEIIPMRNIFAFKNFLPQALEDPNSVVRYRIKDGETPRSLAYSLYANENYDWIFMTLNTLVNPYYDWPLSEESFNEYMEEKYFNKVCFFLDLTSFTNNFKVGEVLSQTNTQGSASAIVKDWNRTLAKLTVEIVSGQFFENEQIQTASSTGLIKRIVDKAEDAVHHFETINGVYLDPLFGFIQGYINRVLNSDLYAITSKQYEIQNNDNKRIIYVMKPEIVKIYENLTLQNTQRINNFDIENMFV